LKNSDFDHPEATAAALYRFAAGPSGLERAEEKVIPGLCMCDRRWRVQRRRAQPPGGLQMQHAVRSAAQPFQPEVQRKFSEKKRSPSRRARNEKKRKDPRGISYAFKLHD